MADIRIKNVESKTDLKNFVKFPFNLYKNNEYWVPPIIQDELDTFNPKRNPSYEYSESKLWLAYIDNKIVGRIAGIKHGEEFKKNKKIRFGWLDFIDNKEVSSLLLNTIEQWAIEQNAIEVHGPMGFTDMDFEGMLVEGFDSLATIATLYNYPYYKDHLAYLKYEKSADWVELAGDVTQEIPEKFKRGSQYIRSRFKLKVAEIKNTKQIKKYGDKMFQTLNDSFTELYGFYKLTKKESKHYVEQYLSYISPKYITFVVDEEDDVVAFGISMPSLSKAFQYANGKLFPFGFIHLLKAMKKEKILDLYLIGVNPKYQNTGAISIVFYELWKSYIKEGVKTIQSNPILESNKKLLQLWYSFGYKDIVRKRRRCFSKKIN